jgi:UDP-N-acetylmuramyl pentapeptide phosphotransferase/UDP-N-acetylglucosamine-1-phosphate transferase
MNFFAPLIAAVVTILLTILLLRSRVAHKIQDVPNERSLHKIPVPRVGGLALIIGVLSAWTTLTYALPWWIVWPVLLLFVVSIMDDLRGLSVRYRLIAHLIAAGLLAQGTGFFEQNLLICIVVILLAVWMTNLYNFMDGSDGLAGGMAFIGFTVYGLAGLQSHFVPFALLNFSIAAAAAGFLLFNFYPAKIFLGDAGSVPLGFLAAAMGLWGRQADLWPAWFPLLVFSPFILDETVTLIKRALRREKIWQAHREHYYQRLVQIGWGHRKTAVVEYVVMICTGASALIVVRQPELTVMLLLSWCLTFLMVILLVERLWKSGKHE